MGKKCQELEVVQEKQLDLLMDVWNRSRFYSNNYEFMYVRSSGEHHIAIFHVPSMQKVLSSLLLLRGQYAEGQLRE